MDPIVHTVRPTVFSTLQQFRLDDDAVVCDDGRAVRRIAYTAAAQLRLFRFPVAFGSTQRRAVLDSRDGVRLTIQSGHYVRLGVIEDRQRTYRPFVAALIDRLAAANPRLRVVVGQPWALWWVWLIVLLGSIAVIAGSAIAIALRQFPLSAALYVGLVLAFLPIGWRVVVRGRPREVDIGSLPTEALD